MRKPPVHKGTTQSTIPVPRLTGALPVVGGTVAVAAAYWGYGLNIDQIALPFGITVAAGLGSVVLAAISHARGGSGWRLLALVLGLVVLAFAFWLVYASQLGDLYDSRS
jgi:hypothetical protein